MILDGVRALGPWAWWVLGLVLLGIEAFAPGFFFLWFGIAAIVVGAGALLVDWPWQAQVVGFLVLSVVAALAGRRLVGNRETPTDDPHLNLRGGRLSGRTFLLDEPIAEGRGRLRIDDTIWQVRGPDAPAGARVVVTGADGAILTVEPA